MLRKKVDTEPFIQLATEIDAKSLGTQNDQIIMRKMNNVLRAIAISHEAGQYDSFHFTTAIFDEIRELKDRTNISKIYQDRTGKNP